MHLWLQKSCSSNAILASLSGPAFLSSGFGAQSMTAMLPVKHLKASTFFVSSVVRLGIQIQPGETWAAA